MYLVLLEIVEKKILDEAKANCEACWINSDSQFDHCESRNCLDEETDHVALYTAEAKNKVQVLDMMIVFDKVREDLGLKPIFQSSWLKELWLGFLSMKFNQSYKTLRNSILH